MLPAATWYNGDVRRYGVSVLNRRKCITSAAVAVPCCWPVRSKVIQELLCTGGKAEAERSIIYLRHQSPKIWALVCLILFPIGSGHPTE